MQASWSQEVGTKKATVETVLSSMQENPDVTPSKVLLPVLLFVPTSVHIPNSISIGSAVFAVIKVVIDR